MKDNMLIITNIKVKLVPAAAARLIYHDPINVYKDPLEIQKEISTFVECIRGKTFINNNGQRICIGMSKQVQEAIGLPFEVFDSFQKECKYLRDVENKLKNKINTIQSDSIVYKQKVNKASFSSRLKYLFTKIII